jgi:hypothetical protein
MPSKFKIGDKVELLAPQEAYGSNYAGSPVVIVPVGAIGVVGSVDVPFVTQPRGERQKWFNCVDFVLPGVYHFGIETAPNSDRWRCGVVEKEMRKVKEPK